MIVKSQQNRIELETTLDSQLIHTLALALFCIKEYLAIFNRSLCFSPKLLASPKTPRILGPFNTILKLKPEPLLLYLTL